MRRSGDVLVEVGGGGGQTAGTKMPACSLSSSSIGSFILPQREASRYSLGVEWKVVFKLHITRHTSRTL